MSAAKTPTASGISRLLAKAGFERSERIPGVRNWGRGNGGYTAGFHVRGDGQAVYVGWRNKTPLVSRSALQAERDKRTAAEMAERYAEALVEAGWPAEVIHLAGPLARVTAKEGD
jgi:hypothetical protein